MPGKIIKINSLIQHKVEMGTQEHSFLHKLSISCLQVPLVPWLTRVWCHEVWSLSRVLWYELTSFCWHFLTAGLCFGLVYSINFTAFKRIVTSHLFHLLSISLCLMGLCFLLLFCPTLARYQDEW